MKINKRLNKILIIVFLVFAVLTLLSGTVLADIPIPGDPTPRDDSRLSAKGYLSIIAVVSAFTLIPFFVLEILSVKNQKLLEKTTDEDTIKKTKKYITTLVMWSTIFLTFYLLFGVYIFGATEYLGNTLPTYLVLGFLGISLFILLLKVISLLRFKRIDGGTIAQIFIILGFIAYYSLAGHALFYDIFKSL